MSDQSKIEWTDATWNPVRGCSRVSEGCRNCYAERVAARFVGDDDPFHGLAYSDKSGTHWTGKVELIPEKLDEPLRWKKPRRSEVNSMSDLFHERLSDEAIAAVFGVMAACPQHTFQILTKRPERMRRWFEWMANTKALFGVDRVRYCAKVAHNKNTAVKVNRDLLGIWSGIEVPPPWPLPNVWLGVSVEDQATADDRIPLLLQAPAALRFVSYEPALGPVDFTPWLGGDCERCQSCGDQYREVWRADDASWLRVVGRSGGLRCPDCFLFEAAELGVAADVTVESEVPAIDWLIVGGESGPGARPCGIAWIRSAVAQCKAAGVPVFVKQLGARPLFHSRPGEPAAAPCNGECCRIRSRKGGDPSEWPEDLRVREFPR